MDIGDLVEVVVRDVVFDVENAPVVLLAEKDGARILPIWVGGAEATAIMLGLRINQFPRPISHDLFVEVIDALGGKVTMVVINKLENDVFYARIIVAANENKLISMDARPSDAIAIALRSGASIYVKKTVMIKGGLNSAETEGG